MIITAAAAATTTNFMQQVFLQNAALSGHNPLERFLALCQHTTTLPLLHAFYVQGVFSYVLCPQPLLQKAMSSIKVLPKPLRRLSYPKYFVLKYMMLLVARILWCSDLVKYHYFPLFDSHYSNSCSMMFKVTSCNFHLYLWDFL